jgi:hypothetical protein
MRPLEHLVWKWNTRSEASMTRPRTRSSKQPDTIDNPEPKGLVQTLMGTSLLMLAACRQLKRGTGVPLGTTAVGAFERLSVWLNVHHQEIMRRAWIDASGTNIW